jgi:3-oxoadipate enol-lactonase
MSMKVKANEISINCEIKGKGDNLVLIHGAGDNLNMWYHQVPVFSKRYRVITYDVRGSGKSASPEGEYSISLFARDAYELMKALKVSQAYFLGYSMGGRIALQLALDHPEMVKALILANSSVGLTPPTPEAIERRKMIIGLLEKKDMKSFAEMMTVAAFSPDFKTRNPAEFDRYMKVKMQNKPEGITRLMGALATPSPPPDLSKIKCPVLIIVGEHDSYMSVEQGKLAQQAIAGSELVILPTGHAAAIEAPDKFNAAVLDFLSRVK